MITDSRAGAFRWAPAWEESRALAEARAVRVAILGGGAPAVKCAGCKHEVSFVFDGELERFTSNATALPGSKAWTETARGWFCPVCAS